MNVCARLQAQKQLAEMMQISKKDADVILNKMVLEVNINHEPNSRLSV